MLGEFLGALARAEEAGHRHRGNVLADEKLAFFAVVPPHRVGRAVAELFIHALAPHVRRLDEVRITRDDTICHLYGPPLLEENFCWAKYKGPRAWKSNAPSHRG